MSASNRFSGVITIRPSLTASEIRRAPSGKGASTTWDAHLRITAETVYTDDGEFTRYTADAIVGPEEPCNGYDVVAQIQALVDLYADAEFAGFIEMDPDPGFGDPIPTRYVVRDRRVVEVRPVLTWPEDAV